MLINAIDLQLRPYEIRLLLILLNSPPKPPLEQTLHQQIVIALPEEEFVPLLRLERVGILEVDGIVYPVCEIDHK